LHPGSTHLGDSVFHRIWVLSAAVVVLVTLPAAVPTADGAVIPGAVVAAGTVTSSSGAALPGATVDLYAWPPDAVLNAMKPGEPVATTLLATATTNSAGGYTLRVPAARLKAAAVESGYANLEIFSSTGGFWFMSYQTGALPARPSAPVIVDLASKSSQSCGVNPLGQLYNFTGFKLEKKEKPTWAVVGQGYIVPSKRTRGDWVSFKYTQGSSHAQASALGLGISGYGVSAGYESAGTNTSTARRAEGFPRSYQSALFRTEFTPGLFRGICYGPAGDSNIPYVHQHGSCPHKFTSFGRTYWVHKCFWLIRSVGWFGGASTVHPKSAPGTTAGNCAPQEKGSDFDADFGTAVEWSSGYELSASLGLKGANLKASFNGSARTGYDANAFMYFKFHQAGYMCGTNGPPSSAAILVMRGSLP
jgi:hypothetical protein